MSGAYLQLPHMPSWFTQKIYLFLYHYCFQMRDWMTTHAKSFVQSSRWIESVLNFFMYVTLICWPSFPYIQKFSAFSKDVVPVYVVILSWILVMRHVYIFVLPAFTSKPFSIVSNTVYMFFLRYIATSWIMTISILSNRNYDQNFLTKISFKLP